MTAQEQTQFARFLRERLPLPEGHKEQPTYFATDYARRALRLPALLHWRDLSREQASEVMQAARREYPRQT